MSLTLDSVHLDGRQFFVLDTETAESDYIIDVEKAELFRLDFHVFAEGKHNLCWCGEEHGDSVPGVICSCSKTPDCAHRKAWRTNFDRLWEGSDL